jgi:protocatechuate 3,4-dioxygenase beta subunit
MDCRSTASELAEPPPTQERSIVNHPLVRHDRHIGHDTEHDDPFDGGFAADVTAMSRRRALLLLGGAGAGALALAACGGSSTSGSSNTTTSGSTTTGSTTTAGSTTAGASTVAVTSEIPDETAGPYPGDGTNGPNALTESGIVRSDITASVGSATGVADGVPLTFTLAVVDVASKTPLAGAAVYAWHCDAEGNYSMYSDAAADENYLRGVQEADANGQVTFDSIVPGCYSGRWPHIHFEVYESLDAATNGANAIKTSQLALPQATCEAVYTDSRYPSSASNLSRITLATDNVFSDDQAAGQLAVVTGDNEAGYVATLGVGV